MDNRKLNLLSLKQAAGLATDAEIAALGKAYRVIGGGLAIPYAAVDAETWQRRYSGLRYDPIVGDHSEDDVAEPVPSNPAVTRTADGLMLCAPDQEQPHPAKPNTHRPHGIGRG